VALALSALAPESARADDVAGAVTGSFVYADGDAGGAAMLDVWFAAGVFRIGGCFGVGATPAERDARNRVMMPLGVSMALYFPGDAVFSLRARGGVWAGATQDVKLTVGGFVGGGAGLGFAISPSVTLSAVFEAWGVLGDGETWAIVPGLAVEWGHPVADEASERAALDAELNR
jgi:hypothetical protein